MPSLLGLSHQIPSPQMQNLAGAALQRAAHLHHLAAMIDASQESVLPQPVMQSLLAHGQALDACQCLCNSITGDWIQEQIVSDYPTDATALRNQRGSSRAPPPAPEVRRFWSRTSAVCHVCLADRESS